MSTQLLDERVSGCTVTPHAGTWSIGGPVDVWNPLCLCRPSYSSGSFVCHPSLDAITVITNKYGRWRARVEELLLSRWASGLVNVQELAATIVGMFDAGASESEVAAFLSDQERTQEGAPRLTDDERRGLVRELHMSAGSLHSQSSEEF